MTKVELAVNLEICRLLERHGESIRHDLTEMVREQIRRRRFPGHEPISREGLGWLAQATLRHLINSIRTRDKTVYLSYCRDLATRSVALGVSADEVCACQRMLGEICLSRLSSDPSAAEFAHELRRQISMTFLFGCDQVLEVYEQLGHSPGAEGRERVAQ